MTVATTTRFGARSVSLHEPREAVGETSGVRVEEDVAGAAQAGHDVLLPRKPWQLLEYVVGASAVRGRPVQRLHHGARQPARPRVTGVNDAVAQRDQRHPGAIASPNFFFAGAQSVIGCDASKLSTIFTAARTLAGLSRQPREIQPLTTSAL
jgi:hypothetical protein